MSDFWNDILSDFNKKDYKKIEKNLENSNTNYEKYILSLIYRIQRSYVDEEQILKKISLSSRYVWERREWFEKSILEKTVPRKVKTYKRDSKTTPSQIVLEQLCFVTGGDDNVFILLVELLGSLKVTNLYKNIPIYCIDCGLTEEQKVFLQDQFHVVIKDPGYLIPGFEKLGRGVKEMMSKPFLPKLFPGYRYYFHLDGDVWIQDERSLDHYIKLCLEQGIGVARHRENDNFKEEWWYSRDYMCDEYYDHPGVAQQPWINAGCFCIDSQTNVFSSYARIMKHNLQKKGKETEWIGSYEQPALSLTMIKKSTQKALGPEFNLVTYFHKSRLRVEDNVLYLNSGELIGIVHLAIDKKMKFDLKYYNIEIPTLDNKETKKTSFHFREYPNEEEYLHKLIFKEIKSLM